MNFLSPPHKKQRKKKTTGRKREAMEVWSPHEPSTSASSSCAGENIQDEEEVPNQQTIEEHSGTMGGTNTNRLEDGE